MTSMACKPRQPAPQTPHQTMITTIPTTIAVASRTVETMKTAGQAYNPRSRLMINFMISLEPAQILVTRASVQAWAVRYSVM